MMGITRNDSRRAAGPAVVAAGVLTPAVMEWGARLLAAAMVVSYILAHPLPGAPRRNRG